MTVEELKSARDRLEMMKARSTRLTQRALVDLRDKNGDVHEHGPQRTSDQSIGAAAYTARNARERELALRRLAEGKYGVCVDCGRRIESDRLEVRPEAIRCTACALRMERSSRR